MRIRLEELLSNPEIKVMRNTTSKLVTSLYTLHMLYESSDSAGQVLVKNPQLFQFKSNSGKEEDLYRGTIIEALFSQILLKTCSFLDEWDKFLGVKTEKIYQDRVLQVKKIAKPARKVFNNWKQLREFRNQALAHNHRDLKDENIYLNRKVFQSPNYFREFAMLLFAMDKMLWVCRSILRKETEEMFSARKTIKPLDYSSIVFMNDKEIKAEMSRIDGEINIGVLEQLEKAKTAKLNQ